MTVVVVAVTGGAGWWLIGGGKDQWTRRHWQPPPQSLLSPMGVEPVPGWKASVNSLGLPSDARFTTSGDSTAPGPIITTSDSRTYVLATSGATDPQWWLAGVDARDGHRLFPPVALNAGQRPPSCFANGRAVVCVAEDSAAATAWVVDGDTGMLTYMGRTDLDLYSSKLRPRQLGDYLVAQTEREGVYGVGPDAAPTWFVGGVGVVASHNGGVAFQSRGEGLGGDLFAMTDGKIIHPDTPPDALVRSVRFFDAGFAAEVASSGGLPAVQLFDDAGRKTADVGGNQVVGTTANLTAVFDDDRWGIYAPDGARLLDLPREQAGGIQLIGSTLWVTKSGGAVHHSQPYDLRTGDPGKPCDIDFGGYLGSDGSVAVRAPLNPKSDDLAQAYDLATCRLAWSIPRPAGSLGRLVRTGDTLVRLSDTGTELASLVAPQ
ncbi:hypothetical protein H7J06_15050 [Mycobacterium hodleri]|uniref:hypothetical protein n=1 Tax=Mycolicibacterium hodleri TaxID=49897 RepID=UPI0021F359E3|nr:hypothetical protein [Mycolicibacterium hodleri]MCV7134307.1 hypothetical protein [Mycolicibacterium hodleri]